MDIDALIRSMTLDEKASLTAGVGAWRTAAIERVGIPAVYMTDGPAGARGARAPLGDQLPGRNIPCGAALGATWNPTLVESLGRVVGEQAREKGCRILLAPTVNLHRSPLGGRNFESYSEDPLLAGRLAAAFVRGAQSEGVACTVKHFAGNESESERLTIDVVMDERAMRELHLRAFELAVKEGGALGIMTAYNRLNGTFCSENKDLFDLLRSEWGFEGFVVTDWYAAGTTVGAVRAGLDIQMPGPDRFFGKPVAEAVRAGEIDEAELDAQVRRLLTVFDRIGALAPNATIPVDDGYASDTAEHRALVRRAAAEAVVLLRNEPVGSATAPLLPLTAGSLRSLALIGPNAERPRIMGGGSAELEPFSTSSLRDELTIRLPNTSISFERGCSIDKTVPAVSVDLCDGFSIEVFAGEECGGDVLLTTRRLDGRLFVVEGQDRGLPRGPLSFRATTTLVPSEDGMHRFSLVQIGQARILLDGAVIVDGMTNPPPQGDAFFGMGSKEVVVEVPLEAQRAYQLTVEYRSSRRMWVNGTYVGCSPVDAGDLINRAVAVATKADLALVVVGTNSDWETEGHDRTTMTLPGDQEQLILAVAAANPNTIVLVNAGAPIDMRWASKVAAVATIWFSGEEMAGALVDVLLGLQEPGGRLPHTIPQRLEHNPTFGNFPGEHGQVRYGESVLVGYRWYQARAIEPAFPFGHGLSYAHTSLSLEQRSGPTSLTVAQLEAGDDFDVPVRIVNHSDRNASVVVQCYVGEGATTAVRGPRELQAFQKVTLEPLGSVTTVLRLGFRSFAHWNPGDAYRSALNPSPEGHLSVVERTDGGRWEIVPGSYRIEVGTSSVNLPLDLDVIIT
jgi:beta-glucosidase